MEHLSRTQSTPIPDLIHQFLLDRSSIFRELDELRIKGWAQPEGDEHFKNQRQRANTAKSKDQHMLFNMMRQIGDELQTATGVLALQPESALVLDLCMAPGGYTASALKYSPHAQVSGVTLPLDRGGHRILVPWGPRDPRVDIMPLDITMLSSEIGIDRTPNGHPDATNFLHDIRPYQDKSFDLVFCDGQVLRTHARLGYRERNEALRLTNSQLILAMQRIRQGGTLVILLHKADSWSSIKLLHQFSGFSQIRLFKPQRKHAIRSSFYLVATAVNPARPEARAAIATWKEEWKIATFDYADDPTAAGQRLSVRPDEVSVVLAGFGGRLIELAEPAWAIQRDALKKAAFMPKRE